MWADNLSQLFTWVYDAYGVCNNLNSHTGGGMLFGCGIVHSKSILKKNTEISTEAKLVGISNYLPYNILIFLFM